MFEELVSELPAKHSGHVQVNFVLTVHKNSENVVITLSLTLSLEVHSHNFVL